MRGDGCRAIVRLTVWPVVVPVVGSVVRLIVGRSIVGRFAGRDFCTPPYGTRVVAIGAHPVENDPNKTRSDTTLQNTGNALGFRLKIERGEKPTAAPPGPEPMRRRLR
ncbi:MAG TPA: hypothetical protein DEB39_01515 [Planctomycetaceae bacterium]|nr:hypothetical protein [Planctomycetaceae bacterium]